MNILSELLVNYVLFSFLIFFSELGENHDLNL